MADPVEAGDLVARLENAEFENQVSLESKLLQQASAQREHDKQKALFEHGGITLRELTDAERQAIDARYALESARLQLARLEVRAPFAGTPGRPGALQPGGSGCRPGTGSAWSWSTPSSTPRRRCRARR